MTGVSILTALNTGGDKLDLPLPNGGVASIFLVQAGYNLTHNYATGATDGTQTGSPSTTGGFANFVSGASFIDTAITETAAMTYFIACKSSATGADNANRPYFMGTYGANSKIGAGIWMSNASNISCGAQHGGSSVIAAIAHDYTQPALISGRFSESKTTIKNHYTGVSAEAPTAVARTVNAAKIRIGSGYVDFGGASNIYFAAIIPSYLSDADLEAVAAAIKQYIQPVGGVAWA